MFFFSSVTYPNKYQNCQKAYHAVSVVGHNDRHFQYVILKIWESKRNPYFFARVRARLENGPPLNFRFTWESESISARIMGRCT